MSSLNSIPQGEHDDGGSGQAEVVAGVKLDLPKMEGAERRDSGRQTEGRRAIILAGCVGPNAAHDRREDDDDEV